jgi:hypothetical protein
MQVQLVENTAETEKALTQILDEHTVTTRHTSVMDTDTATKSVDDHCMAM